VGLIVLLVVAVVLLIVVRRWSRLSSRNQFQRLGDCWWQWGWSWEMVALSSESVFIGDVTNLNQLSIGSCVRVAALRNLGLLGATAILQVARFIGLNSIASRVAVLVAAIRRHFILVRSDWDDISVRLERRLLLLMLMLMLMGLLLLMMMRLVLIALLTESLRLDVVVLLLVEVVVAGLHIREKEGKMSVITTESFFDSLSTHLLCDPRATSICAQTSADNAIN
jgi:hypothetical protein